MANWLETEQESQENIRWILAFSGRYSKAKTSLAIQVALSVGIPALLSAIKLYNPDITVWAAFYGLIIYGLDLFYLESQINMYSEQGARAHERFDCNVLHLDWNEFGTAEQPTTADAVEWANAQKNNETSVRYREWYPAIAGNLPIPFGRLICQLSNCRWDLRLRQRYASCLMWLPIISIIFLIAIEIYRKRPVETLVLTITALVPFINWFVRSAKNQRNAAKLAERQRRYIENLWKSALHNNIKSTELDWAERALQDDIFRRRKNSQPVFNWVYRLFRSTDQLDMHDVANAMVQEYNNKMMRKQ